MLYTPIKFGDTELKNRWVMSPMCMYSSENGLPNDFHHVHYGSRAQGGAGLIMFEATGVEPRGRITNRCLGLWNDAQKDLLKNTVRFIHGHTESKAGIQLAHAGRKGSTWEGVQIPLDEGWETLAPSALPYKPGERLPNALTFNEIKNITRQFCMATERALEAGFNVVEIHAAHGYLFHQFLSPLSNLREDEYGGSFENRTRFLLETVSEVIKIMDGKPLFVRISADEYAKGGWDLAQSVELCKALKNLGVSLVDVSSGGNIHGAKIDVKAGYQVPFASAIRSQAEIATGAVGLITSAAQAQEILQNGDADLIFVGRELLRNPYLPVLGSFELESECFFPPQYERARL